MQVENESCNLINSPDSTSTSDRTGKPVAPKSLTCREIRPWHPAIQGFQGDGSHLEASQMGPWEPQRRNRQPLADGLDPCFIRADQWLNFCHGFSRMKHRSTDSRATISLASAACGIAALNHQLPSVKPPAS